MKIIINEELLRFLLENSERRVSRCEAFGNLYSMITESKDRTLTTSYNSLAKAWKWDNHLVHDFIGKLTNMNIIDEQRLTSSTTLSLTEVFKKESKGLASLFDLLSLNMKRANNVEAFLHVFKKVFEQEKGKFVKTSNRAIANELGWSHHTVPALLDIMERNGIISRTPSTGGNTVELRWGDNIH